MDHVTTLFEDHPMITSQIVHHWGTPQGRALLIELLTQDPDAKHPVFSPSEGSALLLLLDQHDRDFPQWVDLGSVIKMSHVAVGTATNPPINNWWYVPVVAAVFVIAYVLLT